MDSDAKQRACRAILTMAVFLLPAAGAAGEQGFLTPVPTLAGSSLLTGRLSDGAFWERLSHFPPSFVPAQAPAPASLEFELRDHTHEHWLEEFFYTDEGRPPGWTPPTAEPESQPEPQPEPGPAPEPTPDPRPDPTPDPSSSAASPYREVSPGSVPSPLTTAPGPTPGNTLLPENATYWPAPTDLILPDERLSEQAFREQVGPYLPHFGGNPERILDDFKFQQLVLGSWDGINAEHAYARGLSGWGVRIGIDDYGVDILHPEFAGRVQRTGTFLTRKIPYTYGPEDLAEAFSGCGEEGARCRVYEIDASGDRALIEHYAHRIMESEQRFPDAYHAWFIRDISRDADGWHAIPGLYTRESWYDPPYYDWNPRHGTAVASVAAGWSYGIAPGATIVSLFQDEIGHLHFHGYGYDTGDEASKAQAYRDYLSHFDIINHSYTSRGDVPYLAEDWYRMHWPAFWAAFTQRDAQEKTIEVWSAGNQSLSRPAPEPSLPVREPAVRGHYLAAAAAEKGQVYYPGGKYGDELLIAYYSNRCGPLPGDWNPQAHGRHYCLTAPGYVRAALPNGNFYQVVEGTSYAAAIVTGGIALVMERFRGQLSNREVALRVINTANNRGRYSDSHIYGAGLMDLDAATAPVGEVSTGTAAMQASIAATRLQTPAAWGDLGQRLQGVEIAGFDSWNAPFWYPAQTLAQPFEPPLPPPHPALDPVFEQTALLPQLRWFGAGGAGREDGLRMTLWGDGFHAAGFRADSHGSGFASETDYHTFGFSGELLEQLRLGVIVETQTNQGARPAGAFGAAANSKLVWLAREHAWPLSSGVALRLDYLVAAGQPDYARGALFKAGGSLYSSASIAIERRARGSLTRLSLSQPLRAETGAGVLRYPIGRTRQGDWLYASHRFSLTPTARELRFGLRHHRPLLLGGKFALELAHALNAGHIAGRRRVQASMSYHLNW